MEVLPIVVGVADILPILVINKSFIAPIYSEEGERVLAGIPLNGFSHCHECHRYLEENPVIFAEWARRELGEANYDRLRILSQQAYKND